MSQYKAAIPADGSVPGQVQDFFEHFYTISDTADAHEEYASQFTPVGTLYMIADEVKGYEAIIKKRQAMWEKVAVRSHKPAQIMSFGKGSDDFMLYGTVDYTLKDGKTASNIDWAARAHFSTIGGVLKMDYYQVFLDSASMLARTK